MALHKLLLAVLDFLILNGSFLTALWIQYRSGWYYPLTHFPLQHLAGFLLFSAVQIALFQTRGLYKYQVFLDIPTHLVELLRALVFGFFLFVTASFVSRTGYMTDSRLVLAWTFSLAFLFSLIFRCGLARSGYLYLRGKGLRKRVLIVGAGERGRALARRIAEGAQGLGPRAEGTEQGAKGREPRTEGTEIDSMRSALSPMRSAEITDHASRITPHGSRLTDHGSGPLFPMAAFPYSSLRAKVPYFEVVGFIDDDPEKKGQVYEGVPVLGGLEEVERLAREHHIQEVLIAINFISQERMLELVDACQRAGVAVHVVSDLYQVITQKIYVEEFGGILTVKLPSEPPALVNTVLKRLVDLVGSALLLILLSPLFLVLAVLIKLTSKGPVFYKTTVIGKNGRPFTWYKFRSMRPENDPSVHESYVRALIADGKKPAEKLVDDDRITPVGRFIRKHSLDELPQLFNVFLGQMSLVGPRPCLPYEWESYKPWHRRRLSVTPGMTGLWQVTGRSEVGVDDMVVLDLFYIYNRSLALDLEILLDTIPVVLGGRGGR